MWLMEFVMANPADAAAHLDEAVVRVLYHRLLDAWNMQDANGMASLFTEDGSIVGYDGSVVNGREAIRSHVGEIFAHHKTAAFVGIVREERALGNEAALLRAVVGMVPPGGNDINSKVNAIQSLVTVRRDGQWQIALFQNTPAAFHGRPEEGEALTEELRKAYRAEAGTQD
jgi:uncharacterized protein (TIGR02246 family)